MNLISKQSILSLGKFLLLAVVLSACNSAQTKEHIIFFSQNKQGDSYTTSVYSINPDGSGLTHLVEVPALEAILSADGQKLAFTSRDSLSNIYIINLNGTGQKQLTNLENGSVSSNPVWSPDSRLMAFTVKSGTFNTIYTMNVDGSGLKPLDNGSYEGGSMAWSPDGQQIAFGYKPYEFSAFRVKITDSNGHHPREIPDPEDETSCSLPADCPGSGIPIWSPNGSKIVFKSNVNSKPGIYVVNSDGSNRIQVATLLNNDASIYTWSPDGKRIAFVSRREGKFNIYVVMADGSSEVRLTDNTSDNHYPFWSPDGSKIVFGSNRAGNWRIYTMNADGAHQTHLTNNDTGNYGSPIWLPGS